MMRHGKPDRVQRGWRKGALVVPVVGSGLGERTRTRESGLVAGLMAVVDKARRASRFRGIASSLYYCILDGSWNGMSRINRLLRIPQSVEEHMRKVPLLPSDVHHIAAV